MDDIDYTVEDLIKYLKKLPKDTQVRVRDYEEYSETYYELNDLSIEEEWENGVKYLVFF